MTTWTRIGGNEKNPGVYDTGNGAIVTVERDGHGVIRRTVESYCGRSGDDRTTYTLEEWDAGGPRPEPRIRGCPVHIFRSYRTARDAADCAAAEDRRLARALGQDDPV